MHVVGFFPSVYLHRALIVSLPLCFLSLKKLRECEKTRLDIPETHIDYRNIKLYN